MTLYKQLGKLKLVAEDDESFDDFATRVAEKLGKISDTEWNKMSDDLQTWANETLKTIDRNKHHEKESEDLEALPVLEGFPADNPTDDEGDEEETDDGEDKETEEQSDDDEGSEDASEEGNGSGDEGSSDDEEEEATDEKDDDEEKETVDADESTEVEDEKETGKRYKPTDKAKPGKKKGTPAPVAAKGKAKPEKEKPVKAAKAKEAKPAKKTTNGSGRGYAPEATIKILAKENPHREGSSRFKRWSKYKDGMTVAQALKAGFNSGDLRHSVEDGNIKIIGPKAA